MNLTNEGAQVLMNDDYEALCLSVTQSRNASLNNFYQQFALLCLHEGIDLVYSEEAPDTDTRKQFKQLKQAFVQAEAKDIAHRLSLSAALTVPIILINMSQMLGTDTMSGTKVLVNLWAEFLLASPIVFYAAQPIFQRGWSSLKHRSLNMFTLLSLGIGLPFLVSFATLIALTLHGSHIMGAPQVYCESAAVIATLAWLGQYLELRARV